MRLLTKSFVCFGCHQLPRHICCLTVLSSWLLLGNGSIPQKVINLQVLINMGTIYQIPLQLKSLLEMQKSGVLKALLANQPVQFRSYSFYPSLKGIEVLTTAAASILFQGTTCRAVASTSKLPLLHSGSLQLQQTVSTMTM